MLLELFCNYLYEDNLRSFRAVVFNRWLINPLQLNDSERLSKTIRKIPIFTLKFITEKLQL